MFVLCCTPTGGITTHEPGVMASALRGGACEPSVWCDEQGRAGAGAVTSGILPEDVFDHQPLVSQTLVFVAGGRIDNRDEILKKLAVPKEKWPMLADSDVMHSAYRRWEGNCVQHLYGDYAFAAWNRESGDVAAGVDHIGSGRLYYAHSSGKLLLSTQLGALLAHPQAPRDLDLKALGLLAAPKIEAGSTPFKGVRLLPGGRLLLYRNGALETRRWWQPDTAVRAHYRDPQDYVSATREAFDRAVRVRLRAMGNVAAMMSGGLDSTLVAATAARQLIECGRSLTAYLSVPEPGLACEVRAGWDVDDSPYACAVAAMHQNLDLVKITPGGNCTLETIPQTHALSRTPVRNGANHIWIAKSSSAALAGNARVVLQGDRGNATISQSGEGILRDLIMRLKWAEAIRRAGLYGGRAGWRAVASAMIGEKNREIFRRLRGIPLTARRTGAALLTPEFRAAQEHSLADFARPVSTRTGQVDFMTLSGHQWSADPVVQWGIEFRDPTGDRHLIELLLSFPLEAFSIAGLPRGLARAMGEGLIPDSVRFRHTRGDQMPEFAALMALNSRKYRDAIEQAHRSTEFRWLFGVERVRALLEHVCTGNAGRIDAYTVDRVVDVGLFIAGVWR